ncbi:hypothetical protein Tco_1323256 [Tanacetum coccineum]
MPSAHAIVLMWNTMCAFDFEGINCWKYLREIAEGMWRHKLWKLNTFTSSGFKETRTLNLEARVVKAASIHGSSHLKMVGRLLRSQFSVPTIAYIPSGSNTTLQHMAVKRVLAQQKQYVTIHRLRRPDDAVVQHNAYLKEMAMDLPGTSSCRRRIEQYELVFFGSHTGNLQQLSVHFARCLKFVAR